METDLYQRIGQQIRRAREAAGISQEQLAKELGKDSIAAISHYETGQRKISIGDLQKIAAYFGIPLDSFLNAELKLQELHSYLLRASEAVNPSARIKVAEFLSFSQTNGGNGSKLDREAKDPVTAAKQVHMDVAQSGPPFDPSSMAEKKGVPVFEWDFPNEISGILALHEGRVSIGVNKDHPSVRQRFTVAHELGHFLLDTDNDLHVDFSDGFYYVYSENERRQENRANIFAANLLMPEINISQDLQVYEGDEIKYEDIGLSKLAQRYRVSQQAMWIRLKELHFAN